MCFVLPRWILPELSIRLPRVWVVVQIPKALWANHIWYFWSSLIWVCKHWCLWPSCHNDVWLHHTTTLSSMCVSAKEIASLVSMCASYAEIPQEPNINLCVSYNNTPQRVCASTIAKEQTSANTTSRCGSTWQVPTTRYVSIPITETTSIVKWRNKNKLVNK